MKYKIEVGDSLISPNPTEIKLTDVLIEKYRQVKAEYIKTHNGDRKKVLEKEITQLNGHIYYGVKTGFNKAFIIDGEKKAALIAQDSKSAEIIKPLCAGKDVRKWNIHLKDKWLIYSPWHLNMKHGKRK